jgi:hypothetical protein
MATFIQGSTDFIPQIQPWSPNFNFYQNVMATKQSQYDSGWEKTNTLYNSLLNAPMIREEDIAKRDQFFKTIEQDINRLSGIDLSKQQNVDAASQLFTPIIEDENIINDISRTKQLGNERQIGDGYLNCDDPKKCGDKWWAEGMRDLDYWEQDYKNASNEEALQMRGPKYTPHTNAVDKAFDKIFKNSGKLGTSITYSDGKYMITEKNGVNMIEPLMSYIAGTVGRDPAVKAMYNVKARVARRDWLASEGGQYASQEEAESNYIQNILNPATTTLKEVESQVKSTRKDREIEKQILDDDIRSNNIMPGSEDDLRYRAVLKDLGLLTESEEQLENEIGVANSVSRSTNMNSMRFNADATAANAMLYNDMYDVASTYQQLTHEIKQGGADPYAMAKYNSGLRRDEAYEKFIWDTEYDIWKDEQKAKKELESSRGGYYDNALGLEEKSDWMGSIQKTGKEDVYEANKKFEQTAINDIKGPEAEYLSSVWNSLFADLPINENEKWINADRAVVNDFIQVFIKSQHIYSPEFQKLIGEDLAKDIIGNVNGIRSMPNKILKRLNENGKASISSDDLLKLPLDILDAMMYDSDSKLNPDRKNNDKKPYAVDLWNLNGLEDLRENVATSKATLDIYKNLKKENHKKTNKAWQNFATSGGDSPEWSAADGGLYGAWHSYNEGPWFEDYTVDANGNRYDGGGSGYNPFFRLQRNHELFNQESTYHYFIKSGLDLFLDENGDKVSYPIFEDKMLEKSLTWYKDYKNGIAPTEEDLWSSKNISRTRRGSNEYDPENSTMNRTIEDAKTNIHLLYHGKDDQSWSEYGTKFWDDRVNAAYAAIGINGVQKSINANVKDEKKSRAGRGEKRGVGIGLDDLHRLYWMSNEPGVKAINSIDGGVGGLYGGKVLTAKGINPTKYTSDKFLHGLSVLKNITESSDKVTFIETDKDYLTRVGIGGSDSENFSNADALSKIKNYADYFYNQKHDSDDDYIPIFDITYDPNYNNTENVKVNIKFDANYIEDADWILGDNDDKQAIKRNKSELAAKGISVIIPKSEANNTFEVASKRTNEDKILQSSGVLNFSDYVPNIGSLKLKARDKIGNIFESGYSMVGSLEVFDPTIGKYVTTPLTEFPELAKVNETLKNNDIDAGLMRKTVVPLLKELAAYNKQESNNYKRMHGLSYGEFMKHINSKEKTWIKN